MPQILTLNSKEGALKIAYVILHYNAYEMTCESIDCILKIKNKDSEIVVVDNNSTNNSGKKIIEHYADDKNVHVVISKKNLGFAKGNNLGYLYAKRELCASVIVDINNDILIYQKDFEKVLCDLQNEFPDTAVVGPNIINRKGFCQNPYRLKRIGSSWLFKSLILHCLYLFTIVTKFFYKSTYAFYHRNDGIRVKSNEGVDAENVVLHGSCVIFMKHFVENSDFAFVPSTFFYGEEDLLFDYATVKGFSTLYTNRLNVHHMEKIATSTIKEDNSKRELFQVKNRIYSRYKLLLYRIQNGLL